MKAISISEELRHKVRDLRLYCIQAGVVTSGSPEGLWSLLLHECRELGNRLKLDDISALPAIHASRLAYKATGKDPARYRLSAEALLRRAVKEKELYQISNVVDIINLVSLSSGFSIGGYDADKIRGNIEFGIGRKDEAYTGIGRGALNIEGLPVFRDDEGAFGSPTSDSPRTCVDKDTIHFLMVIIVFGANHLAGDAVKMSADLLENFAQATNMEIKVIS